MTPLGPSGFPHDLERFRPVEREEVQVLPASRIEMPVMLRASPMDRGGLQTWLATRKAESDKKREEEVVTASNPWLAKSYRQPAQSEKKKEASPSSNRLPSPVSEELGSSVQGSIKEKLRQDLLKAWSGPEAKAPVEPRRVPEPLVAVGAKPVEGFAPINLKGIHPMGRMRAEMQAAAQRTWLASRPDGKVQENEEESSKKEEIKETRALALRKSLLSAWGGQEPEAEVAKKMDEVSLSVPAASNSSTVNVDKPSVPVAGCGRPLLAAWTSGQCPIKEASMKETRRSLLSSWTSGTSSSSDMSSLEIVENLDANNSMDDAASEASIVTLDTITDDSDDFDDFSDMKHELCQWISQ